MATGILVSYSGYPYTPSSFLPDNGLANLAGALVQAGHAVRILDFSTLEVFEQFMTDPLRRQARELLPFFFKKPDDADLIARFERAERELHDHQAGVVGAIGERILQEVDAMRADWVGFKLYLGDGLDGCASIADFLRERRPRLRIFAGGPAVDLFKGHIFRRTSAFDALVYAEGENAILPLMDYVEGKRALGTIPNVVYLREDGQAVVNPLERPDDLDALPYPCYSPDVYPAVHGGGKLRILTFDESRGCPFKCAFCIHSEKSGRKMRLKSVDRMLDELRASMAVCNTRVFRFAGSATPYQTLVRLAERLIAENLDIMYSIYGTAHHLDCDILPLLRRSGLWAIFYGVESADPDILDRSMGKRNNRPEQMQDLLRATMDADIFTVASIIYPAPGETAESGNRTFEFLRDVFKGRKNCSVPVTFSGLFPTTDWMADPKRYGFETGPIDDFMAAAMAYKIKSLLPYWLWADVPYRLDGKNGPRLQLEASQMIGRLEAEGITTMLLDDSAMIGALGSYDLKQYRRDVAAAFYTGDVAYVSDLVDRVNSAAAPVLVA